MRAIRAVLAACLILATGVYGRAGDRDLIPANLPKDQRENLLKFLEKHQKPTRYVPADAKVTNSRAEPAEVANVDPPAGQPLKQFTVQIMSHRPVPGQEQPRRADVYYYRPNPTAGKQGITVKYTVDLANGEAVGAPEVLLKYHTPISHEELTEAVELAKQKSAEVKALYKDRESKDVRWEYLQMKVNKPHEQLEPGDRVVRFVFTATPLEGQPASQPTRVIVNLTKGVVSADNR